MNRLQKCQNNSINQDRDIMTWGYICETDDELEQHVLSQEKLINEITNN